MKEYNIDNLGVIHQIDPKEFSYDKKYIEEYDEFKVLTDKMGHLRLGYLIGAIGKTPGNLIDFGYGNGSFLEATRDFGIKSFGTDISGYKIPDRCTFVESERIYNEHYDVFCFFDSLEHVKDLGFIKNLKTDYIYISLPWCHYHKMGEEWFMNWKHRKPNEHLHHFDKDSLVGFFNSHGYALIGHSNIEDVIRKPVDDLPNILTAIFKKNKEKNNGI